MDLEAAKLLAFLCVHLVLKILQMLLESIDVGTFGDIVDENSGLEDVLERALLPNTLDAF